MKISPGSSARWPTTLIWIFASVAAILWLLPLLATRPVLFPPGPNFEDIFVYKGRFTLYHTARFFTSRAFSAFAYPAGAAPLYQAFYDTGDATQTYLILATLSVFAAIAATFFYLRRLSAQKLLLPLVLLVFPLIFLIQRANIELILWIVIVAGILAYRRGWMIVAATLFGLAAAVKLYPILLLGLFLRPASSRSRKDIQAVIIGMLTALLAMAAAIEYTGPTFTIAARGFFNGVDRFQGHYVDTVSKVEVAFDHCLFSPIKYLAYTQHVSPAPWRTAYYLCAAILAVALFFRVHTLLFLNRIVFLVAAMVCLPPVSFTYTLVHLYLPALLLFGALLAAGRRPPVSELVALALLLFLFIPLPAVSMLGSIPTGPLQALVLLTLLITCALEPWHDRSVAATL